MNKDTPNYNTFDAIKDEALPTKNQPLAVRMRPSCLSEIIGQDDITARNSLLSRMINSESETTSIILYGPPGTGKTTIAYLFAKQSHRHFVELSATSATVKDVRAVIDKAKTLQLTSKPTVLFIDEVHRFSKAQQDVLLPSVENKIITLIAATTENPNFSVISPLLSRSVLLKTQPLTSQYIKEIIYNAISSKKGYDSKIKITDLATDTIAQLAGGDARKALTILEVAARFGEAKKIDVKDIENASSEAFVKYDKDGENHYDTASAFIKSIRGSDVDAALHYLARMLVGGEDPRFIARRMMISASEDVGMGDPNALLVATAAAQAVQLVGMPEARIILSQACVYLATAPKSNAAYLAINQAISDIEQGDIGQIPLYLRDSQTQRLYEKDFENELENNDLKNNDVADSTNKTQKTYKYAHDFPFSIVKQQYLPDELKNKTYYHPKTQGFEAKIVERLKKIRKLLRGE